MLWAIDPRIGAGMGSRIFIPGGELRRFGLEQTSSTLDSLKRVVVSRIALAADLRILSTGWETCPCTPYPQLRPAASSYPRVSTHAGQPVFAGGEPLDVPEAMELLSGMKRQKRTEGPDLVKDSRDGIRVGSRVPRWAAGHRHERRL